MPSGKKIKIQEITNFTFFDPKQKLFKVELSQMKPQKCIKFPKCSLNMPKIDQNMSEKCLLCTFIRIVQEIW